MSFKNRTFPLFASLVFLLSFALSTAPVSAADEGAKAVYHVDFNNPTRYSATLTSINNIIDYYDSQLMESEIHLVFVGYGLRFTTNNALKGTPYEHDQDLLERRDELKGRLQSLINVRGVKVHLCDKTRDEVGLPQSEVYKGIQFTDSGVAKIAMLQSENFAYLKIQ